MRKVKVMHLVKRIARWYLAPSGLLLALALLLLALSFAFTDIGRWFGLGSVAALAVFLPYRFARQQGWADRRIRTASLTSDGKIVKAVDRIATVEGSLGEAHTDIAAAREQAVGLNDNFSKLDQRVVSIDRRSVEAAEIARTSAQTLAGMQNLHGDVAALRSRVVDRLAKLEAGSDSLRALSTQVQQVELQLADLARLDAELPSLRSDVDEAKRLTMQQAADDGNAAAILDLTTKVADLEAAVEKAQAAIAVVPISPADARNDLVPPDSSERLEGMAAVQSELETAVEGLLRRERLSGAMTGSGFHHISRSLTDEDIAELVEWASRLGLTTNARAIAYLAHEIRRTEDLLIGRMAGSLGSAALRTLVLRAVKRKQLNVVEIGSLFGVSIAAMEATTFGFFEERHFTAVDPLDGYYQAERVDVLTGLPVSREIFDENMRRVRLSKKRLTVLQHLSTDNDALNAIESGSADVLFIDGDHSRFGVEFDYRRYKHVVASGGFIILDDYQTKAWPDVTEFVDTVLMADESLHCVGKGWETAVFRVLET